MPEDFAEVWRSVVRYGGLYEVSSHGRVRHTPSRKSHPQSDDGCIATRVVETSGYLQVCVYYSGKRHYPFVHTLVAEAFHGPRPKGKIIAHEGDNKLNNRSDNLEYITPRENTLRAFRTGVATPNRGERAGGAKLTDAVVREIRSSKLSAKSLAGRFGVSRSAIGLVRSGKTWTHVA